MGTFFNPPLGLYNIKNSLVHLGLMGEGEAGENFYTE